MDKKELYQLLDKSKKGTLSPEEQARLDQWYADFDTTAKDLDVFADERHEKEVHHRLLERILDNVPSAPTRKVFRIPGHIKWAAAILLIGGIAFFYREHLPGHMGLSLAIDQQKSTAPTGKLLKVHLEDGSEITLNAGATLSYPRRFAAAVRAVYLEGEAF